MYLFLFPSTIVFPCLSRFPFHSFDRKSHLQHSSCTLNACFFSGPYHEVEVDDVVGVVTYWFPHVYVFSPTARKSTIKWRSTTSSAKRTVPPWYPRVREKHHHVKHLIKHTNKVRTCRWRSNRDIMIPTYIRSGWRNIDIQRHSMKRDIDDGGWLGCGYHRLGFVQFGVILVVPFHL
jgi:hypothetical protein